MLWLRLLLALLCLSLGPQVLAQPVDSLAEVRARGALIIGTDATYPPFESIENGKFVGFDIDLGTEIARELGVRAQFQNIAWDGIFAALQTGKFDLVISDVVITDKRKRELAFSRPYFPSGQVVVRRKGDARLKSSKDLPGKRVAVQTETTGQYAAEKIGLGPDSIQKFETMQDALLDVRNGRSDAAVGDLPALSEMIRKGYPELEVTGGIFVSENYAVVARKGKRDRALLQSVNAAIGRILSDGRYARIYAAHLRQPMPPGIPARLDTLRNQGTLPVSLGAASTSTAASASAPNEEEGRSALSLRFDVLREAAPLLVRGAILTLWVTLASLLIGIPLGLFLALVRRGAAPLRWLVDGFVEVIRGTPLLMQLFVIYFVLPAAGLQVAQAPAAIAALALNASAYVAEIFRAGLESLDRGQGEAARALGMSAGQSMRWVILPQVARRVLPPLTNEAVAKLKDSSLVSIIGLSDLTRIGREQASNSGAPVTIVLAVALCYLLMTLPLTFLARRLEARWNRARLRETNG